MKSWFSVKAAATGPTEVDIYDEIGLWGITAKDFVAGIKDKGDLDVTIHSPGGDVSDGLAIYNALRSHKGSVTTRVDTLAASMASIIALAGDEIQIADNGFFMIHNPWTIAIADADGFEQTAKDLRKMEDTLAHIYVERTGQSDDDVRAMMRKETWMTAQEAIEAGFASEIYTATKAAACAKDFNGDWGSKIFEATAPRLRPVTKEKQEETMPDSNNDKALQLQAKLTESESAISALEKKLQEADIKAETATKAVRDDAAEIVALGKAHSQLDLAVKAISDGKSVDEFKGALLDAYASEATNDVEEEPLAKVDANREPADRSEFLATYRQLEGRVRADYYGKYASTHLK